MNRSPRRSLTIQSPGHLKEARQLSSTRPPLRGRLAAVASPKLKQEFSEPVIRKRPAIAKSVKGRDFQDTPLKPKPNPELPLILQWLVILFLLAISILIIFD